MQNGPFAPRMLGRYALYEKIASGGMASVHLGRLLGPVGFARTVAIKRMHPQFAEDPEFVSMFLDEARLAARIRHPNVVPTLDVVAVDGELVLVMEFVQGESLARLIRSVGMRGARIPPPTVAAIVVGLLQGLHAAHEATNDRGEPLGIVHRDVSPHNVLVGVDGVARVLDFGVAKAAGRVQTTREGQLKGKLAYMAPEQVRGSVTRTTDVYAASVVLWEALTGKRLFHGENEAQVLDKLLRGCADPPSMHAPGLAGDFDALVMRGLDLDPTKRFATARDMARALEEVVPLTSTSKVGDWVEAVAKETIDARSQRIASIESDTSLRVHDASMVPRGGSRPEMEPLIATDDAVLTQLSSGSASSPHRSALRGARRRMLWVGLAGAAGGVSLAIGLAVALSRPPQPMVPVQGVAAASPSDTPPATTPAATATPAARPLPTASTPSPAPSASAASAPVASAPLPESPPPAATAAPRTTAAPARPAPASRCTPPWYFDARGVRVFKPECL